MPPRDPSLQPEAVQDFLRAAPPFDRLPEAALADLAASSRVTFFLAGEDIVAEGDAFPWVCCVQRGGVRLLRRHGNGAETLVDLRGEGECFGAGAALAGGTAACRVQAVEDTFLVCLDGTAFAVVAKRHLALAGYFQNALAAGPASAELVGEPAAPAREQDGDYLFTRRVGEVASRSLVDVRRGMNLRQAARIMEEAHVGSVLVREVSGAVIGIVTDRDLRRAVADGLGLTAPVETLMSAPVVGVAADTPCFEALIAMTEAGIRHLAVARDGEIIGLVTANDVLLAHGRSPMALLRAIRRAETFEDLYGLSNRNQAMAAALAARGATAAAVGRILTMVAERVLARLLELLARAYGPPPAACCWLALGEAGRGELLPGLGLGLAVVSDDSDPIVEKAGQTYAAAMAEKLSEHLAHCGLDRAPWPLSLANPENCTSPSALGQRLAAVLADFGLAADDPALGLFDARPVAGDRSLAGRLREQVSLVPSAAALARLAGQWAARPVPLGVYQGRLMERDGSGDVVLDLAGRGSGPIAAMARLLALRVGLAETGTLARLDRLVRQGYVDGGVADRAREAFEFFERLRLVGRLQARPGDWKEADRPRPASLSARQRQALKSAFAAVEALRLALAKAQAGAEVAP